MTVPTDGRGWTKPVDSRGNEFNPFAGSSEPVEGRCKAVLTDWRARYGRPRFCTGMPEHTFVEGGSDRCRMHTGRDGLFMRAKDVLETGLHAQTVFHFYDKIHPTKKVLALAWYDDLVQQSVFDFDTEMQTIEVDFSKGNDSLPTPPYVDDDSTLELNVPFATQNGDQCASLMMAATHTLKMLDVDSTLVMMGMENETATDSELDYETGEWNELTEFTEHHLNLPYDRLIRTKKDLLEAGGVGVEEDTEPEQVADTHIEVYGDPSATEPLPETIEDEESLNIPVQ